jgi:hypothetical protein
MMRASQAQRDAERKRCEARRERVREINGHLANRACGVALQNCGAGVAIIHFDYPGPDPEGDEEYLILETFNDVQFDEFDLADSSAFVDRCQAINNAIELVKPLIAGTAVKDFKARFKELMA